MAHIPLATNVIKDDKVGDFTSRKRGGSGDGVCMSRVLAMSLVLEALPMLAGFI